MFSIRRRTVREERLIDQLLKSPLMDQALDQVEAQKLQKRRAAIAAIEKLDALLPGLQADATEVLTKARLKLEAAEKAAFEAKQAFNYLTMVKNGAVGANRQERGGHERILAESADPRVTDFYVQLMNLRDAHCQTALTFWPNPHPSYRNDDEPLYYSNAGEIRVAKAKIEECLANCHDIQAKALTNAEICEELKSMCEELAPVLAKINSNPPSLSKDHCEVGGPISWMGYSVWMVDQLLSAIKPEREPESARAARIRKFDSLR